MIALPRVEEALELYRIPPKEFVAGLREFDCSPWSTVTYTPLGWKGPCYLIGQKYFETWDEFWNGVDWEPLVSSNGAIGVAILPLGFVADLEVYNGQLYAGGLFQRAGGQDVF